MPSGTLFEAFLLLLQLLIVEKSLLVRGWGEGDGAEAEGVNFKQHSHREETSRVKSGITFSRSKHAHPTPWCGRLMANGMEN